MALDLPRRQLLLSMSLVGLAACSEPGDRAGASRRRSVRPTAAGTDPDRVERRRLERASFGVTPAVTAEVAAAGGFDRWVDAQLAGTVPAADPALPPLLAAVEADLAEVSAELAAGAGAGDPGRLADLVRRTVTGMTARVSLTAAFGGDQLRQRVVDWLGDLLHVSSLQPPASLFLPDYDRVLRAGAFGRFADLLVATARHPAMLSYLDQATSRADRGRRPNENYARELMELHTVGVDGGYDEADVVEVAHVLSGWSLSRRPVQFLLRAEWHDPGPVASGADVLGWRPSPGATGAAAGVELLEHLANHPATARRVAHGLGRRLVSEDLRPDDPLVAEAAEVYRDGGTALAPVVRHLLTSDRFATSATLMVRRPVDLVASVLRTGAATITTTGRSEPTVRALAGVHRVLGQVPYGWPAPDGFPWGSAAWSNAGSMVARWNTMVTLAHAERVGVSVDPAASGASDRADLVRRWCGPGRQLF